MHRLVDTYNRQINYLRISITDRCNLRCMYCMPKEGISLIGHDDILRYEEILRIARIAVRKGISKIRLTGGEPLVRKGIISCISRLRAIPGISDLTLTTNGILLESAATELYRAGVKRINISLDSLDTEKYRSITRGGSLDAVMAGIRKAHHTGFSPIKINVVVMRGINDDEILSFAELSTNRPAHIRFIEFMPLNHLTHAGQQNYYIPNTEIMRQIETLGELIPVSPDSHSGPASLFQLKGAVGRLGFISALSNHFCATCNRLRLTADGKLRTCLFSDDETDLKTPLRQGCSEQELEDIITRAILSKPSGHKMLEPSFKKCCRGMSAIGG